MFEEAFISIDTQVANEANKYAIVVELLEI
jgi:hypothetical protein